MKLAAVCLGVLLCWSSVSAAEDRPGRGLDRPERARDCGHATELEAAKRALSDGDREVALSHLRRARALVAACERSLDVPERKGGSAASAFARAPAAESEPLPTSEVP